MFSRTVNSRSEAREAMKEIIRELMPMLEQALANEPELSYLVHTPEFNLSKKFVYKALPIFQDILNDEPENRKARYDTLHNMITLEMVSNSDRWTKLSYYTGLLR